MTENLSVPLKDCLNMLCKQSQQMFKLSELSSAISKERHAITMKALKPKNDSKNLKVNEALICNCTAEVNASPSKSDDNVLFDEINQLVNKAKSLRINPTTKVNQTSVANKKLLQNTKHVKSNSRSVNTKTSSTSIPKDKRKKSENIFHLPSCPMYDQPDSHPVASTPSETYKVPTSLNKILVQYKQFCLNTKKGNAAQVKKTFLDYIDRQNEETWITTIVQDSVTIKLPKYMSALKSVNTKLDNFDPFILYHNRSDLHAIQRYKTLVNNTTSWNIILRTIIDQMLPVLENDNLNETQKIYIYKLIKGICNFVQLKVPNVPFVRINVT